MVSAVLALPYALTDLPARAGSPLVAALFICLIGPVRGLISAPLNALLLRWTATTPGKWLCGVRIMRKDGGPLTFGVAIKRELDAFVGGCGLYFPLVSLLVMGLGFRALRKKGATSWDEHHGLVAIQRPDSPSQGLLTLIAFLPVGAIAVAVMAFGQLLGAAARGG